ncbi:MAG: prepilin-type N-terminal cleavage/methylation domain-containing protein [Oscillospiraceae bacterium]|nr:prepilin-type N-terminal cleavage/methylation domain-containing protein [Oscillospiraceae bacterium]
MRKFLKSGAGFSLIEVVVAIAILGLVTVPVCGLMVQSHRMNARSEALLQAELAVSNKVETLMASGVSGGDKEYTVDEVVIKQVKQTNYYTVTVTSTLDPAVSVKTSIRSSP